MTYSEFQHIESEVISLVDKILDSVKEKSFSDYVLLISRANYQVENERTKLSPYVLSSQLEIRQDITRERFLVEYINAYVRLLKDNVFIVDDMKELNLNIQMMVYAQIWESHRLIKTILRIAKILAGEPYEWKIPFEYVDCNGKTKSYQKAKIWEDRILKYLNNVNTNLAKFIKENYDSKLRNDFAHASYYIDIDNNSISFLDSERYSEKRKIDIYDWEQHVHMLGFFFLPSYSYNKREM